MTIFSLRARPAAARRLTATLYLYTFLADFILLYPVYTLLFTDTGLSAAEISSLFIIWSVTGIVLEIPTGAWADAVSRRLLLGVGPLLGAAGYALWVLAPAYWVFAAGFVLWGTREALSSGALEALVYEELDRVGAADQYARIMGRARAVGVVAVLAAIAIAGPVFGAGGYLAVGAASVFACLLGAAVGWAFPEHRPSDRQHDSAAPLGYVAALRTGLAEAHADRSVRRALLLAAVVPAVWGALEEYVPLLVRATGVPAPAVPLLVLIVSAGVTAGGLLAPIGQRMTARLLAGLLALAALALAAGSLSRRPAGLVLVAASFGAFQLASVVVDARLQERITGPSRATVTSLAGLGTGLATIAVYGGYAVAAAVTPVGVIFALFAMPYVLTAVGLACYGRWFTGSLAAAAADPDQPG